MKKQCLRWSGTLSLIIGLTGTMVAWSAERTPEETVRQYVQAVYSRNYAQAYPLISDANQKQKSREEYLQVHVSFGGTALQLAAQLASYIRYANPRTDIDGDRARVTLELILPNGNDPKLRELLLDFDEEQLQDLSQAEQERISAALATAYQRDELPVIVGEERFELVKQVDGWKLLLYWDGTVLVRFTGEVMNGLPWDFEPIQGEVRAPPGETLRATYRVRNRSDTPVSGKARTVIHPAEEYLEVIQCFCFIQQTLDPGEEVDLPLVFRVNGEVPSSVQTIDIHYEFYPLEHFKSEWERSAGG